MSDEVLQRRIPLPGKLKGYHVLNPQSHVNKPYVEASVDHCGRLVMPEEELSSFLSEFKADNYGLGESVEIKLTFIEMTDFDYSNLPEFEGF